MAQVIMPAGPLDTFFLALVNRNAKVPYSWGDIHGYWRTAGISDYVTGQRAEVDWLRIFRDDWILSNGAVIHITSYGQSTLYPTDGHVQMYAMSVNGGSTYLHHVFGGGHPDIAKRYTLEVQAPAITTANPVPPSTGVLPPPGNGLEPKAADPVPWIQTKNGKIILGLIIAGGAIAVIAIVSLYRSGYVGDD